MRRGVEHSLEADQQAVHLFLMEMWTIVGSSHCTYGIRMAIPGDPNFQFNGHL